LILVLGMVFDGAYLQSVKRRTETEIRINDLATQIASLQASLEDKRHKDQLREKLAEFYDLASDAMGIKVANDAEFEAWKKMETEIGPLAVDFVRANMTPADSRLLRHVSYSATPPRMLAFNPEHNLLLNKLDAFRGNLKVLIAQLT